MSDIEKVDLESEDLVADRVEQLKELFPEVVTEGESSVDFDKLQEILGAEVNEEDERYAFTWPGKHDAIRQAQTPTTATLRPCPEKSVDWDTTENLYIEGDNLEVLKLLQRGYHGKIKIIYIDPPYNTGHDFVYKDSFEDNVANYKEQTGLTGQANADTSGRYHSDWCSMMYPRLKLARELLTNDGVIFISIDDSESASLKNICDEIYGPENFLAQVIWERAYSPINLKKHFSESHDYILCYARRLSDAVCNGLPRSEEANERYTNPDNDPRGPWKSSDLSVGPVVQANVYEIITPSGRKVLPPSGYCWRLDRTTFEKYVDENRIWFGPDGNNVPSIKRFLSEVNDRITPTTIWKYTEVGHSQDATKKLKELFDGKAYFEYPKPVGLIKRCLQLYSDENSVILDFFSGSATTAHAVMQLNAEDGGNRKFIMVQLPEVYDENSEAGRAGYSTICDIGEERIRRAGKKITEEVEESNKQLELGAEPRQVPDIGFRVLKLDESGVEQSDGTTLLDSIVKEGRSDLDIIFEMMLKWGLELTLPIEEAEVLGYHIYSVAADELICCMEEGLTVETLEAIAEREPRRVFILDSVLDDTLKLNAVQIFERVGEKTGIEIELRTV